MTASIAISRLRLPERRIEEVSLRVLEVRVIEDVEEVGIDSQPGAFSDLEGFAVSEVKVDETRARN